ncbi:MAG: rod shape-determining protein MreC [Candidatus Omnitrophota bacterium]
MRRQRLRPLLIIIFYIFIIYLVSDIYINKPKFIILYALKSPFSFTQKMFYAFNRLIHPKYIDPDKELLKKRIGVLEQKLLRYKEIEVENFRLNNLLQLKNQSKTKFKAARIIARDPSNFSSTVVLDKGRTSGLNIDDVIVVGAGLVGRICDISKNTSRVMVLGDRNFCASAIVSRSRQIGMVYGTGDGYCKLRYLPLEADIEVGDKIVTSGFSDIFPKGLFIGRVYKIKEEPRGLGVYALLVPAADISNVEEVLCIE